MNDRPEQSPEATGLRPDEIEVRTLADRARLPSLRALASDMAMRQDYDLDSIGAIRLAVEEVCTTVVCNTDRDRLLVCRLLISSTNVEIIASVPIPEGQQPVVQPLNLRILRGLADSVDIWTTDDGARQLHVWLAKSAD